MKSKAVSNAIIVGSVLFFIGAAIAAYSFSAFVDEELKVTKQEWERLGTSIKRRRGELRKLQNFVQNIEKVKSDLRELNLQLESALEHMPRTFDLSGLLRRLSLLAQNSGLEMSSFSPGGEQPIPGQFYNAITINFNLRGTFTQTVAFLDQLSRLKRIVNVENLNISVGGLSRRSRSYLAQTSARIRTYRFSD